MSQAPTPPAQDDEAFYEALAGRGAPHAGARALRDALVAEARTVEAADLATSADIPAGDRAQLDAVRARLVACGALAAATSAEEPRPHPAPAVPASGGARVGTVSAKHLFGMLNEWLAAGWQKPLALACGLLLGTFVVLQMVEPPESPDVLRGDGMLVHVAPDPGAAALRLTNRLTAAGGTVVMVQVNQDEWALQVDADRPDLVAPLRQAMAQEGLSTATPPPFKIEVRKAGTDSRR